MLRRLLSQRLSFSTQVRAETAGVNHAFPVENVWGFCSKSRAETLLKEQKQILRSIGIDGKLGSVRDQLAARGFDEKSFKLGCQIAYRKVAEVYERGDSVFETECADFVETKLASQLDAQLRDFRLQAKLPRLSLDSVDVQVIGILAIPKRDQRTKQGLLSFIQRYVGGPLLNSTLNHFVSLALHFVHPAWNELVIAVEFIARERFELIPQEDASVDPPRGYVNEMHQRMRASEQLDLVNTIASLRGSQTRDLDERKHLFIFAADLAMQSEGLENGTEADFLEFRLRSMGQSIQLPRGIAFADESS